MAHCYIFYFVSLAKFYLLTEVFHFWLCKNLNFSFKFWCRTEYCNSILVGGFSSEFCQSCAVGSVDCVIINAITAGVPSDAFGYSDLIMCFSLRNLSKTFSFFSSRLPQTMEHLGSIIFKTILLKELWFIALYIFWISFACMIFLKYDLFFDITDVIF